MSLRDGFHPMRAAARARLTFVTPKVSKSIRSAVHGCTNAATPWMALSGRDTTLRVPSRTRSNRRGRKLAALRHTASCFLFALRRSVARKSQLVGCLPSFVISCHREPCAARCGDLMVQIATVALRLRNDKFMDAEVAEVRRAREVYLPRRAQRTLRMWGKAERNGCRLHEAVLSA